MSEVARSRIRGDASRRRVAATSGDGASIPAGTAMLGARSRATTAFGWDNEFDRARRPRAGVRHRRAAGDERAVPRVHERRRLQPTASCGVMKAGSGSRPRRVQHPAFWLPADRHRTSRIAPIGHPAVALARHVRAIAAAARLARLRQPRGSVGLRAMEGTPADDRAGVPSRRRGIDDGALRFRRLRSDPGGLASAERGRRLRSRRQRLGMDVDGVRAVRRLRRRCARTRSTPPTSSTAGTT